MKAASNIKDKLLIAIIAIAMLSAFAPIVIVFLGNLTTAMSGTSLAALFSTSFLTLLFGIFAIAIIFTMFKSKG